LSVVVVVVVVVDAAAVAAARPVWSIVEVELFEGESAAAIPKTRDKRRGGSQAYPMRQG
jgi:hypothetical protein